MLSRKILYPVVAVASVVAVLATVRSLSDEAASSGSIVTGSATTRWPVDTLRDWADFADQLSIIRIESEEQLPLSQHVVDNGEGVVARNVTARIERTLWQNPGSPHVDGVITFGTWGWVAHDGVLTPATDDSSVRLEVGDRVLAPLLLTPEGSWGPLAPSTVVPIINRRAAFGDLQRRSSPELANALDGRMPEDVAALLASVPPRPNAAALRRLDADARARELATQP